MAAIPARYDLTVYQGDDWQLAFRLKTSTGDYEVLTGKVGKAQIRGDAQADQVLAELTVAVTATPGEVVLSMTSAATAALPAAAAVYDVQLRNADGSGVRTVLAGKVQVVPQVTR